MSLYGFLKVVLGAYFKVFHGLEVIGTEHVPPSGGLIVASNHKSNLDPIILGVALPRRLSFVAKEELFRFPVFKQLITNLGAFPVKRGAGDRGAIREAVKVLGEGKAFVIFPEGTRSKTDQLLPPKPGAAMLSTKAQVPILPVAIHGTDKKGKIRVIIGEPLASNSEATKVGKDALTAISQSLMARIGEMLKNHPL